ncbi:MAG: copper chaperone [Flavobacteriales bacterium]|jgi:copper chaperone CopZ|nr:copper chaperone [Flavobacteriales bacterium]
MRTTINLLAALMLTACGNSIDNERTASVRVNGNCGMCKATIEEAALQEGVAMAEWDKKTRVALITFDSTRTTVDAVLARIAAAGYDSEKALASDTVYADLPHCCHYERTGKEIAPPKPGSGSTH